MAEKYEFEPIGFVESRLKERYETPQQGVLSSDDLSIINLVPFKNFEQAVKDLDGFERIWVIYMFHLNNSWKPLVTPPGNKGKKVGVFASRSPHRPNNIGLSCVTLVKVEGLKLYIKNSDILDGSPVLDIKPYIPYADSFPESESGWVKTGEKPKFTVKFSDSALITGGEIVTTHGENISGYATVQLTMDPKDTMRKRIHCVEEGHFILSYKKWEILYTVNVDLLEVFVIEIRIRS